MRNDFPESTEQNMGKNNNRFLTASLAIAMLSPVLYADKPLTLSTGEKQARIELKGSKLQKLDERVSADMKATREAPQEMGNSSVTYKTKPVTQASKKDAPAEGYTIPYHKDFPTEDSLNEMTIIDANNDGSTWTWDQYQKYARLSCPQSGQDDDWLMSAPIQMEAGKIYEFAAKVSAGNPNAYPPALEICVGDKPEVSAMTTVIVPKFQISKYDTYFYENFQVPTTGKYYIGIHGCSSKWLALIKFMYFDITGGAVKEGPAVVDNASIEPDWSARTNNVDIKFTAPKLTGEGKPLTKITKIEIKRSGDVVKTFDNPTPGQEYTFTDNAGKAGEFTYTITGYNDAGTGGKYEKTVNVGAKGKTVPYLEDFTSETRFKEELTLIDYNDDGSSFWHATLTKPPYAWLHYGPSSPTTDDYLITPAIALEENTIYEVSADMWGYGEGAEILIGTAPKVGAFDTTIVPLTLLPDELTNYSGRFTASYTGNYFIAIHAKVDKRYTDFHVSNISLTKVGAITAPSPITDLEIAPKGNDGLTFKFKAPTTTLEGKTLQALDKITVKNGTKEVKTFEAPAPGAALTFDDVPGTEGEVTYTFIPTTDSKDGESYSHVAFIGTDVPAQPQNVKAEYIGNGQMKVTWDPVTLTAHGIQVPAKEYIVLESKDGVQSQIKRTSETSYTYKAIDPEDQSLIYYGIFPVNTAGENGEYGLSNDCYAGTPYKMSFKESFADGAVSSVYSIHNLVFSPSWMLATNASFSDVQPSDGDNGMIAQYGGSGSSGRFSTGIIDLSTNAKTPTLSFNVYNINPEAYDNEMHIDVQIDGKGEWEEVASYQINQLSTVKDWVRVTTDLSKYKGKNVVIGFRPVGKTYLYTIFDAIRVANLTNYDLGMNIVASSPVVTAGENVTVTLTACNNGQKDADKYTIEFYKNGKLESSKEYTNLKSGENKTVTFNQTLDVQDTDVVEYYGKVIFNGDENDADNVSKTVKVEVSKPVYPEVRNLSATHKNGDITLKWDEPSMDNVAPAPYTETFEKAESWNQKGACDWTFVDLDKTPSAGFEQFNFPGITIGETVTSWFVIDKNESTLGQYGSYMTGVDNSRKTIGSLLRYDQGEADDWAISPELYGGRQIVRFFTKAFLDSYAETFQGYYSTGSLNPEDFVPAGVKTTFSNGEWTEMTVSIPAGAKRFAIRRTSKSGALMLVDNVSLRLAGGQPEALKLTGYNVYRNGVRINKAPVTEKSFADHFEEDGTHVYAVTAVYEQGESNSVHSSVELSGLVSVVADGISVKGYNGSVAIFGAEGLNVNVASVDGRVLYNGIGTDRMTVKADRGVVMVKVGNRTFKVIVK